MSVASVVLVVLVLALALVVAKIYRRVSRKLLAVKFQRPEVLVVLGSGGHTGEMLDLMRPLMQKLENGHFHFVVAKTDVSSANKLRIFLRNFPERSVKISSVRRSREVGQSYWSSVFTTMWAVLDSLILVFKANPNFILTNGPGTCVPVVVAGLVYELVTGKQVVLFFCESFCRTRSFSLTGRLVRPFADRVFVFWPQLKEQCPDAILLR